MRPTAPNFFQPPPPPRPRHPSIADAVESAERTWGLVSPERQEAAKKAYESAKWKVSR